MRTQRRKTAILTRLLAGLRWLAGLEWLALAVTAPLLLFPTVRPLWTVAALGVLVALWLLRWLVRREPWPVTPFNGVLLLFALMVLVSIWISAMPELTLPEAARLVLGLAVFRATALAVRDWRSLSLAVAVFCLLGLTITAVGAVAAQWPGKVAVLGALAHHIPRLLLSLPEDQGTPGVNPNHLAGALVLFLPLAVALVMGWRFRRGAASRTLLLLAGYLVFLIPVAGVLVLTQSRSGWIGGSAGLLALSTLWGLTSRRRWVRVLGAALPLLMFVAAVVGLLYVGPQRVGEVLYGAESDAAVEEVVGTVTVAARVEIWSRALYGIQDFPFTGCGLGTFRRVVHILYPLFLIGPDHDIGHAHNIFLQTALDLGLPGLVAYLALLGVAGASCWRAAAPTPGPSPRFGGGVGERASVKAVALGLAAGLVGLHTYGLADALALGSKPGVAFWMALGLVAALDRVGEQNVSESEGEGSAHVPHASRTARHSYVRRWLIVALTTLHG